LILAGNVLFAGGADQVMAVEADTGKTAWFETVEGAAKGLAVAGGRLLVSTDKGRIYSFASAAPAPPTTIDEPATDNPFAGAPHGELFARAAESILKQTEIRRGFCLVYGCETGQLAWELAKRTELMIYAVSPDAQKVAAARAALDAAGLHGSRVCVEHWPLDQLPYSDYFANLVVSETALLSGQWPGDTAQLVRMVKPLGGTIMVGQPDAAPADVPALSVETAQGWLAQPALAGGQLIQEGGIWTRFVRGPLAGAGNWTHLYANLGNTACGDDQIVKPPLGLLWFGNPGPGDMANRHVRAASPLAFDGRLFVQGENVVMAYDIYNGLRLWRRELPGAYRPNASHDGSNLAVCGKGLLVAIADRCLLLNMESGETIREFGAPSPTPGNFRRWGYVAADGQTLYGTRSAGAGQSDALFAVDIDSGEQRWSLDGKKVFHNTIAMGDDLVFVVSSDVTDEQRQQALAERRVAIAQLPEGERKLAEAALANAKVRLVMCLNKSNGQVVWQNPLDLTELGDTPAAMYNNGVLVLFGVYLDGHYWQQFFAGEFAGRRVTALAGGDGKMLWSQQIGYRVRPLIIGDTLHAEPWAFDLKTGQTQQRVHPVTGQQERWQFARPGHHCGAPSASPHTMFFRSWNLGYYDLDGDYGTVHFGGQRPGCWINFLPVGGLAVMAEASTGCMCDFPNQGTVVFQPVKENKAWAWFSAPGLATPVNELALNLGALGDRRDASGKLWLAYPRPSGSLVLQLEGEAAFYPGGRFLQGESVYAQTSNTEAPWLYASAADGLRKLSLRLVQPGDGTATYRVRLAFSEPVHTAPGQRVFDILLQGKVAASDYDIAGAAGGANRAVTAEFAGIEVTDNLIIELVSKQLQAALTAQPVLQAVELVRERFTSPGCTPPAFVLNNFGRQQTAAIKIVNMCEQPFAGSIRFDQLPGFAVSTPPEPLQLAAGSRLDVPVTIAADEMAAGEFLLPFSLLRADGSVELERKIRIEHLGNRTRMVVRAIEDTHVNQRYPTRNWAAQNVLLVDGGNQAMNDADHAVALLKFQLDIPGTPLTAKFRITNAGNPTGDAGRVCLVESPWQEKEATYSNRPPLGRELARLGPMIEHQTIERALDFVPPRSGTLSLAIDPTSTDGVDFLSREAGRPAELVIEYNAEK
jgi:outer membrane protein assembly factor BamB